MRISQRDRNSPLPKGKFRAIYRPSHVGSPASKLTKYAFHRIYRSLETGGYRGPRPQTFSLLRKLCSFADPDEDWCDVLLRKRRYPLIELNQIREIHIEITSKCNASCPMCQRSYFGGPLLKGLNKTEIHLPDFKNMFPQDLLKQLDHILFCGNLGDPILAKDIIPIISYIYQCHPGLLVSIHTNGSLHTPVWWQELASGLQNGFVCFGIDGLEDTHSKHRRGTDFKKIIQNAKAFIQAGGNARWYFLVFKHNQHQVEPAKKMAKELGFTEFNSRYSQRFKKDDAGRFLPSPIWNRDGQEIDQLEIAEGADSHPIEDQEYQQFLDKTEISCMTQSQNSVYVSADKKLYPCCMIHSMAIAKKPDAPAVQQYLNLFSQEDVYRLNEKSWVEALQSPVFQKLPACWNQTSIADGKPLICSTTCGQKNLSYPTDHRESLSSDS